MIREHAERVAATFKNMNHGEVAILTRGGADYGVKVAFAEYGGRGREFWNISAADTYLTSVGYKATAMNSNTLTIPMPKYKTGERVKRSSYPGVWVTFTVIGVHYDFDEKSWVYLQEGSCDGVEFWSEDSLWPGAN